MWITPKTNWKAEYDAVGIYQGDYFNITDYNRIKNNLLHLREIGTELFYGLPIMNVGVDKHYPVAGHPDFNNDNIFADEINLIEDSFQRLVDYINLFDYGKKKTFYANGAFVSYTELNRLESAELDLYNHITSSIDGKHYLAFRMGQKSSDIKI